MLSQLMEADFDECCELSVRHGTRSGFVPNHWGTGLAPAGTSAGLGGVVVTVSSFSETCTACVTKSSREG